MYQHNQMDGCALASLSFSLIIVLGGFEFSIFHLVFSEYTRVVVVIPLPRARSLQY